MKINFTTASSLTAEDKIAEGSVKAKYFGKQPMVSFDKPTFDSDGKVTKMVTKIVNIKHIDNFVLDDGTTNYSVANRIASGATTTQIMSEINQLMAGYPAVSYEVAKVFKEQASGETVAPEMINITVFANDGTDKSYPLSVKRSEMNAVSIKWIAKNLYEANAFNRAGYKSIGLGAAANSTGKQILSKKESFSTDTNLYIVWQAAPAETEAEENEDA